VLQERASLEGHRHGRVTRGAPLLGPAPEHDAREL
jgi:hypothetical protein